MTSGGLRKSDLMEKDGKIISKKAHARGKALAAANRGKPRAARTSARKGERRPGTYCNRLKSPGKESCYRAARKTRKPGQSCYVLSPQGKASCLRAARKGREAAAKGGGARNSRSSRAGQGKMTAEEAQRRLDAGVSVQELLGYGPSRTAPRASRAGQGKMTAEEAQRRLDAGTSVEELLGYSAPKRGGDAPGSSSFSPEAAAEALFNEPAYQSASPAIRSEMMEETAKELGSGALKPLGLALKRMNQAQ